MYIPAYYRNTDLKEIEGFIRENSFVTLITTIDDMPFASHIPMELSLNSMNENVLCGHLSSSWYNHMNVPTWNYIAVHEYGKIKLMNDEMLKRSLEEMVNKYELISKKPFHVSDMPPDMLQKNLKGIRGFEISMDRVEGKWKMSQNRDAEDHANIIRELEQLDDLNARLVADIMKTAK